MRFFFNGGSYVELIDELKKLGHEIVEHDALWLHHLGGTDKGLAYNEVLKREILRTKPDVYLCTKTIKGDFRVYPETHEFVRKNVGITVYWSQDDPFFMPHFIEKQLYRGHRIALTCTQSSFEDYYRVGVRPYLFWPAFDTILRSYTKSEEHEKIDFVFVGTPYMTTDVPRKDLVIGLLEHGVKNIELYGDPHWINPSVIMRRKKPFICGDVALAPFYKGEVHWGIVHNMYARSKLNLSNHVNRAEMYLNDRVPMVLGVGGFLFLDKMPGLENVFVHEKDVVYYDDLHDFIKKAKYYIENVKEREQIAENGRSNVLKNHTYRSRAAQLIDILNENGIK